ncbi:MAG: ribonuclease P protein component [Deltaproteobacteria bacterium]|nr:ribonuclease P protein component [Deltaproteobacteria bacterium]
MPDLQSMEKKTFTKHERIRKRKEYLTIDKQGVRSYSENFIIIVNRNRSGVKRLGITVSKKVGNAVKRNRIKRLLREFFRLNKSDFADSQDIVIIVKRDIPDLTYQDVNRQLERLIQKKDN